MVKSEHIEELKHLEVNISHHIHHKRIVSNLSKIELRRSLKVRHGIN